MKAKRRAVNKACREQFEEKTRNEKQQFVVDLDDNVTQLFFIPLYDVRLKIPMELASKIFGRRWLRSQCSQLPTSCLLISFRFSLLV